MGTDREAQRVQEYSSDSELTEYLSPSPQNQRSYGSVLQTDECTTPKNMWHKSMWLEDYISSSSSVFIDLTFDHVRSRLITVMVVGSVIPSAIIINHRYVVNLWPNAPDLTDFVTSDAYVAYRKFTLPFTPPFPETLTLTLSRAPTSTLTLYPILSKGGLGLPLCNICPPNHLCNRNCNCNTNPNPNPHTNLALTLTPSLTPTRTLVFISSERLINTN